MFVVEFSPADHDFTLYKPDYQNVYDFYSVRYHNLEFMFFHTYKYIFGQLLIFMYVKNRNTPQRTLTLRL